MAEQAQEIKAPIGDRNTKEIYVDGICQIHLVNGSVKMDLLTLNPNGTEQPDMSINQRLVMSLQQFLSSLEVQNKMVDKLVEQGIISKQ